MPFITEELWGVTARRDGLLALAPWPRKAAAFTPEQLVLMATAVPNDPMMPPPLVPLETSEFADPDAEAEIGWVVDLVTAIRSVRAEMNIAPATQLPLVLAAASAETRARAERWQEFVQRLARVASISFPETPPPGSVHLLIPGEDARR